MVSYMKEHFPSVQCTCSVCFKMGDGKRDRVMTDTGFVEFITSDVREFVLSDIESNPEKHKFVMDGKVITVRRARTRRATKRNTAFRNAADTFKKLSEMEHDVEIKWDREGQQRGVKIKGTYAFTQASRDSLGSFTGDFEHLDL